GRIRRGFDQRLQVRAAPRDQHANPEPGHQSASAFGREAGVPGPGCRWRRRANCVMTISRPRRRDDTGSGPVCNELYDELAMGLPLRRVVAALSLLLLAAVAPARAAEDDPYSVTIGVDATSDTIGKARDMARSDGQRKALAALVERLSGAKGAAKLPKLDDKT